METLVILQKIPANESNGGLGHLHPREINLLKKIRSDYRFGTIEIQTADGLPKQIIQTIKRELLE